MRKPRLKLKSQSCYYHLTSRICGSPGDFPFGDIEKEKFFSILECLSEFYFLDVISFCCMSNHIHITVFDPQANPSDDEIIAHYEAYMSLKNKSSFPLSSEDIIRLRLRLTDISSLMKDLKQSFTVWFNHQHHRRGTLWGERFHSSILEGEQSLWSCVKYGELNPVRAGMVDDPADYRFCSWGRYKGTGKHPFQENFLKHIRANAYEDYTDKTDEEVFAAFASDLARIISTEGGKTEEETKEAMAKAGRKESMPLLFLRRSRYWTDGAIIGSKAFVKRIALKFDTPERVEKKRMGCGRDEKSGKNIHSYKLIRD
jgi:putative transposase